MNILEKIKSFFRPKNTVIEEQFNEITHLEEEKKSVFPSLPISESSVVESIPYWLENEDALRDEGVIFGLSNSKPEEKVAIIRNYFSQKTATIEKKTEQNSEKIGEINLVIGQKEVRIDELKIKHQTLENREVNNDHHFPRTLVGLGLSLGMCAGNYFLIFESMKSSFHENTWIISLGVFLAGMFSLFNPTSFFHEKEARFSWRQILEEVGMPLSASFFVFVQTIDNQPIIKSIALFLFVLFLFLFSGKLLLGNLTVFKNDFTIFWNNHILKRDKVVKSNDWEAEIQQLTKEIDEQRLLKWQILPDLNKSEAELATLNAQRDMMIKLFESEYDLARSFKEKLSDKQIKQLLK